MPAERDEPAEEIRRLQRCINDLVSVLALPAMWTGGDPAQIAPSLLEALLGMLQLDVVYIRLNSSISGAPIELARTPEPRSQTGNPEEVCEAIRTCFGEYSPRSAQHARIRFGHEDISLVPVHLGLQGEIGVMVAGSRRRDFPRQTERLLLSVASNQAAIGLQEARLLSEQRRLARDLDQRVAQRTAELAAANTDLRREIAERARAEAETRTLQSKFRHIIDSIPGLVCTLNAAGTTDLLNQKVLEYFGTAPDDLRNWAFTDAVHPDDLPRVIAAFSDSMASGTPYDIEHRCRRVDGIYRWFQVRALPVRDSHGGITGWYVLLTDIDDRKRAEDAIRESERNLTQIIDTIPALAWAARLDGSAVFFSQHYLDYVGLSAEQAKDWAWATAVHPEDLGGLMSAWQLIMASNGPGECEARLRRFDGVYRWFLFRTNPFRDESGQIVNWYGVNTDIDDRKRAEEERRHSEARKTAILDSALDCVLTMNHEGRITEFNPVAERTFGYHRDQVLGKPLADVIIPEGLREQHREGLARHLQTGEVRLLGRPVEMNAMRADGSEFPVELTVSRIPLDGPPSFTGFLRDITQRKQAGEKLRRSEAFLLEGQQLAGIGNFSWRVATDEILWSEGLYRIFDFEPSGEITFERIASRVHPEDLHFLNDMVEKAQRAVPRHEYSYRLLMPDGSVKYLSLKAHRAYDKDGQLEYIGAAQDETQRWVADDALSKARSELARVARISSFGALTASIAHEVNQPLAGIIMNADTCLNMLGSDPPNLDGARATARRTIRDGRRAAEVIARLRTLFSKKETTTELMDLNEATREVIALSLNELQRSGVLLRAEFAEDLPAIMGDRIQLQQVILNLILNASQAMSAIEDRPRNLTMKTLQTEKDEICLSVRDTGVGLSPQQLERIFEPFYTTKADGMGIGLSVSLSIITNHRGRLWAAPNEDHGATFAFAIPRGSDSLN